MKDVNLNSLKIFLAVATSNSFLEASNKLYISQPAISKSINKLEEELGVSLFYRANKGVSLTSDGEILLKYVRDSQKLLLACERMLSSNNDSESGSIIIGVQSHLVRNYLLDKMSDFMEKHPNVTYKVIELSTLGLIEALEKHEIDFVVDASPIVSPYNNLKVKPIHYINTCFIKSKNNKSKIKQFSDLENEKIIMPLQKSTLRKNLITELNGAIEIKPILEFGTEELIIESVKRNLGIGYVVQGENLNRESETIEVIDLKYKLPTVEINLVCIENNLTPLSKKFIKEELSEAGGIINE